MSKIHAKTGLICMICDEPNKSDNIVFHKTRRQTHSICMDCGVQYLRPILKMKCNNIRKNIRNNDTVVVKCPGSYHCAKRNQCKCTVHLKDLNIKECDISLDIFRILYTLQSDDYFHNTDNGKYILQMKNEGKLKFCPQCKTACLKHNGILTD
jgi:hypothetical protein